MRSWLTVLSILCFATSGISVKCDGRDAYESPGYKLASEMLTKNMNFSVDPCEDFFEFTCGRWIAAHPIPDGEEWYTRFDAVQEKVLEEMKDAFESPETFDSKSMNAIKSMYHKCMDKKELKRNEPKRLLQTIRSYGMWPMVDGDDKWRVEKFDLTSLMIFVGKKRGLDVFIAADVSPDDKNVSRRLIQFDQVGQVAFGREMTRDYYLDRVKYGERIELYREGLVSEVELINEFAQLPSNNSKIAKDVDEVIEFESKIAKIMVAEEDRKDQTRMYNLCRLADMEKLTPMIQWSRYIHSIAPPSAHNYLATNPEIIIREIGYMRRVSELLHSTDPRIITNYVFIRFVSSWMDELADRIDEFTRLALGKKRKAPKGCTSQTMRRMQYAAGAIYVSKVFDQALKNSTLDMVNDLQEALQRLLVKQDWMDRATKKAALEKTKEMLVHVAYPEFILDSKQLDNFYNNFSVEETDSHSQMVEKLSRWIVNRNFKLLSEPVDRAENLMDATGVNAFYKPQVNGLELPAALLRAPNFHHSFPRALNYGGLGAIIGHEITHGFDNTGKQYDAFGNLRSWWDANSTEKFEERAQCIIDQYGKIEVPGTSLKLNGKLTVAENIADIGGLKLAYKAYKKSLEVNGREKRIRGLEKYNNEQMFFIGFATIYCGHHTQLGLINRILTDEHSPNRYRVNQAVANQPEFAAAFKCAVGTPMNPTKRCAVW